MKIHDEKHKDPEKEIVERVVDHLVKKYGFSRERVRYENSIKMGNSFFRADATILDEKDEPLVLIEVKSRIETSFTTEHFKDILKKTGCPYGVLSDGKKYIHYMGLGNDIIGIPDIIGPKQLEKSEKSMEKDYENTLKKLKEKDYENTLKKLKNRIGNQKLFLSRSIKDKKIHKLMEDTFEDNSIKLRPFQKEAIQMIRKTIGSNSKRILFYLPNGSGKTLLMSKLIKDLKEKKEISRVLWVSDIVASTQHARVLFEKLFPEIRSCLFQKGSLDKESSVYFSTIQTINNHYKTLNSDFFDLIIIDGSLGSAVNTYSPVLDHFKNSIHLGMSANTSEKNNLDVINYFGRPLFEYTLKTILSEGPMKKEFNKKDLVPLSDISSLIRKIYDLVRGDSERLDSFNSIKEMTKVILCKIYDEKLNPEKSQFWSARNKLVHSRNGESRISYMLSKILEEIKKKEKIEIETHINISEPILEKIITMLGWIALTDKNGKLVDKNLVEKLYSNEKDRRLSSEYYMSSDLIKIIILMTSIKENNRLASMGCPGADILLELSRHLPAKNIYGFDLNRESLEHTKLKLLLNNSEIRNIFVKDIGDLYEEWNNKFNRVIINPPFGVKIALNSGKSISSDIHFLREGLKLLNKDGLISLIVPEGFLFRKAKEYKEIRETLKKQFEIKSIVSLPLSTFMPFTGIKTSLLTIKNTKPSKEHKVLMINLEELNQLDSNQKSRIFESIDNLKDLGDNKVFEIIQNKLDSANFTTSYYDPSFEKDKNQLLESGETIKLEDRTIVMAGEPLSKSDYSERGIRVIKIGDIERSGITEKGEYYTTKEKFDKKKLTKKGDILLATTGTIGKIGRVNLKNEGCLVSSNITIIRPKNIDELYLYYILQSDFVRKQIKRITYGAYIKSVSISDLKKIIIPFPDKVKKIEISEEMRKLESRLKRIDEKKREIEKEINNVKNNMHEMVFR
jgi:tRNA1(Val) A37 N6-methylase TrmN6